MHCDSSHTHREIVAAVASLKSCLRSVVIAVSAPAPPATTAPATSSDSKIQGSVQRANDAVTKLQGLLTAVADQSLRLPLETSKRLVDVGLPDLLQQLLTACQLNAAWPAPASAAEGAAAEAAAASPPAGTSSNSNNSSDGQAAAGTTAAAPTAPAALHPSWEGVQALLQAVFSTLSVLTSVLIRACTRSADPAMVLMQLASPAVMEAQVAYMQQLGQHAAPGGDGDSADARLTASALQCAPACVAAFSSIYSLLATATDAQPGLDELRQQLINSLCSTQLLPTAAQLLLLVPAAMGPEQQQDQHVQAACQAAGWNLQTLFLFLAGAGISISPASFNPVCVQPGQPLPSSMMAASIREEQQQQTQQQQPLDLAAAFAEAAAPSAAAVEEQLLSAPVLDLLQERLYHCVTELRGSYTSSSSMIAQKHSLLREASAARNLLLLPGRCCPDNQDVLHAALRALRGWRALLMSPAAPTLPLVSDFGVQLLLTLLAGVLAEPIRAGSSEREALRGRVIRVAVHVLQLLCSCLSPESLFEQLPALTSALAGVVGTAGSYWDSNKRAVKSEALPYTGQVRCVDKTTGDMMVRYTMAAQSSVDLLRQLLTSCRAFAAATPLGSGGDTEADGGARVAGVMLSAGVLPALEQLFRQLPVVSPAHVTAAVFLVELLPLCMMSADLSAGQLPLLVTLRKFITKSVGIAEPDSQAGMCAATQFAGLLGMLATVYSNNSFCAATPASAAGATAAETLLKHAAVQLLPALQAYVSAVLKAPIPAPHSTALLNTCSVAATAAALSSTGSEPAATRTHLLPVMLATYQQLAALACSAPHLQLGQVLLSSQALSTVTDILCSNYWLLPGFLAAAGVVGSSNSISAAGRVSPAVGAGGEALTSARSSYSALGNANTVSGTAGSSGNNFTGEFAVLSAVQILDSLVASTATTTAAAGSANTTATVNTTSSNKQPAGDGVSRGMHSSCSADCLCASKRSEGAEACQIGNPQCGMDGWCCCSSPKACSDITPPLTPAASSSAAGSVGVGGVVAGQQAGGGVALAGEQQLLLVLSGLLQSKLLPELLRVVQQLPLGAACIPTFSRGGSPRALDSAGGGVLGGGFGRPASTTALMVNVPPRRGSLQRDARGVVSPTGASPKSNPYSPLGHSAPASTLLAGSLRSQPSATESFLTAYMGGEPPVAAPPTALGFGNSGSGSGGKTSVSGLSTGLRVATTGTTAASRFASSGGGGGGGGSAVSGSSPKYVDDGAYGLLRAGSSGSTINWTAGTSLLMEAGVRVVTSKGQQDASSSGYGSSPSLASLASPHGAASSFQYEGASPFVVDHHQQAAAAAGGGAGSGSGNTAGNANSSLLQERLASVLFTVAQSTLALADAGLLGPQLLQRRPSTSSVGGDSDSGTTATAAAAAAALDTYTAAGLPRPALYSTNSVPALGMASSAATAAPYSSLQQPGSVTSGFKPLASVTSGPPAGFSSYYLQQQGFGASTPGSRSSFSGSGHYGTMSAEEVVANIRSCLAAAAGAAAIALPGSGSDAPAAAAGAGGAAASARASKEFGVAMSGSPIGAQQGSIPVGQVVLSSQGGGCLSAEASNSDVIFPVELGLSQLHIAPPASAAASDAAAAITPAGASGPLPAAPPCTPATPAVVAGRPVVPVAGAGGGNNTSTQLQAAGVVPSPPRGIATGGGGNTSLIVPVEALRRLQGAVAAAAPLLSRVSAVIECEVLCPQLMLARLSPRPVGCWNPACVNMPGPSEAAVVSKPCTSCKVAVFCSKACERQAWSEHTMACSRLAAAAAAAAVAATAAGGGAGGI